MGLRIGGEIEKENGDELSYSDFVERYLMKNQPVVLRGLMDGWRACKDWVTHTGQPNLDFFSTHFGKSIVQVADCGTREFTDQKRMEMSVAEFIDHWLKDSANCHVNATTNEHGKPLLYLKDWHFVKEYPEYLAYTTPLFFRDDWLNLYLDNYSMHNEPDACQEKNEISCSDYRFVYMGAKGTWTPLHADVFRSYSWSANVCGKKKWLFLPPSQSHLVFDRNMKSSVYNICEDVNEAKFPGFKKAVWLECIQEQDEIIFVPSGWYHQVHNLEDTISINHNWFNAYNLSWVWDLLLKDYNEAKEYIEDVRDICDDFEGLCQRNLAANTGMNFCDFFIFIACFSFANLVQLYHLHRVNENPSWCLFPKAQHLALNLLSAQKVVLKMKTVDTLAGDHALLLDLRKIMDDSKFLELCSGLDRTYTGVHKEQQQNYDKKETLLDDLGDLDFIVKSCSQIYAPEDLVSFIDSAVKKLSGAFNRENPLLPELDELSSTDAL
ncbi:hypothetical protein PVL29_022666 [Vitis rotundifolia]|uniref:JmjC domain-containing protein n=1 Tax=Vitis rotundifolia TaxID=103349 RepID=A0AA38YW73_VITRO|nr:hypothetical protein PVL29_022666 [Vitis rotundifolia]